MSVTTSGDDDSQRQYEALERLRAMLERREPIDLDALSGQWGVDRDVLEKMLVALNMMPRVVGGEGSFFLEGLSQGGLEAPSLAPPELPADFEISGEIGRGGMGVVYRARQRSLGRDVAVKVLRPGDLFFGEMIARFRREAQSLAKLRHPHIVSIHQLGETQGLVYFTMDLIDGESLARVLKTRGKLEVSEAVRLLRQIAGAVAYAHEHGVVHRDLKPGNILISTQGDAYVVDFGLALDVDAGLDQTRTGQLVGTPAYMSPEQARGERSLVGEATDIHALGAILFECLTGRAPFEGPSLAETMRRVIEEEPPSARRENALVPKDLDAICRQAMAKRIDRRFPNARALLEDLDRFSTGRAVKARPPGLREAVGRSLRRRRDSVAVGLTAIMFTLIAYFGFIHERLTTSPTEALLTTSEDLQESGKFASAVDIAERALAVAVDDDTRRAAARRLMEASMAHAEAADAAHSSGAAAAHAETLAAIARFKAATTANGHPIPADAIAADMPLDVAFLRARIGSGASPDAASSALLPADGPNGETSTELLLRAFEPFILDPERTGTPVARAWFGGEDAWYGRTDVERIARWFRRRARTTERFIAACLDAAQDGVHPRLRAAIDGVLDSERFAEVARMLLVAARRASGDPVRAGAARDILSIALPWVEWPVAGSPWQGSSIDVENSARILDAIEPVLDEPRGVRLRRYGAAAVPFTKDARTRELFDVWCDEMFGDVPPEGSGPEWFDAVTDDVIFTRTASLIGLQSSRSSIAGEELVRRLGRTTPNLRRAMHVLLSTYYADRSGVPVWPRASAEPNGLVARWRRFVALEDEGPTARLTLSLVAFDIEGERRVLAREEVTVAADETRVVVFEGSFDPFISAWPYLEVPGCSDRRSIKGDRLGPWRFRITGTVMAEVEGADLIISWNEIEIARSGIGGVVATRGVNSSRLRLEPEYAGRQLDAGLSRRAFATMKESIRLVVEPKKGVAPVQRRGLVRSGSATVAESQIGGSLVLAVTTVIVFGLHLLAKSSQMGKHRIVRGWFMVVFGCFLLWIRSGEALLDVAQQILGAVAIYGGWRHSYGDRFRPMARCLAGMTILTILSAVVRAAVDSHITDIVAATVSATQLLTLLIIVVVLVRNILAERGATTRVPYIMAGLAFLQFGLEFGAPLVASYLGIDYARSVRWAPYWPLYWTLPALGIAADAAGKSTTDASSIPHKPSLRSIPQTRSTSEG